MQVIEIDEKSNFLHEIERIYLNSFPEDERIPFADIVARKAPNSKLLAFCKDEELLGFSYVSCLNNFAYIIYLAMDEKQRNKGYGTQAVKTICDLYKDKTKVLCIEKPVTQNDLRSRRIGFYQRNGFSLADFQFKFWGVEYFSMYSGKFDEEKFKEFLLVCFPECKDFKKIEKE